MAGLRNAANNIDSQLFYSYSTDGGVTWSPNVAVSNSFTPLEGWPQHDKIGDYITVVSDNTGGDVAVRDVQLQPEPGPARTRRLFCSCVANRRTYTYADSDCVSNANGYTDGNTHGHSYTYSNRYTEQYAYSYAEADAYSAL